MFTLIISCSYPTVAVLMPKNFYPPNVSQNISRQEINKALVGINNTHAQSKIKINIHTIKETCNDNTEKTKKYINKLIKNKNVVIVDLTCEKNFLQTYNTNFENLDVESSTKPIIISPFVSQKDIQTHLTQNNKLHILSTAIPHSAIQNAQAQFLQNQNNIALVHDGLPYAKTAIQVLENTLLAQNITTQTYNTSPPNRQDYSQSIKDIINSSVTAVVFEGSNPGALRFLQQLRTAGFTHTVVLPSTLDSPHFREQLIITSPEATNTYIARTNNDLLIHNTDAFVYRFFLWYSPLFAQTNISQQNKNIPFSILQTYTAFQLAFYFLLDETQSTGVYNTILGKITFNKSNIIQNIYTVVNITQQ